MSFWLTDSDLNRYDFPRGNMAAGFPVAIKRQLIDLAFGHGKKDIGDQKVGARKIRVTTLLNGDTGGFMRMIDDCGDNDVVGSWTERDDAMPPLENTTSAYIKQGSTSMRLRIDADLDADDFGWWESTNSFDLSIYQTDWIYLWIYIPTVDYLKPTSFTFEFVLGNSSIVLDRFRFAKSELTVGWNLIKCDLENPDASAGVVNWDAAIDYWAIVILETPGNVNDFEIYVDDIKVWRVSYQAEFDDLMRWLGKHDLKFYKDSNRYINVETMDLRSHSFIIGDSKATAELELHCPDPFWYKDSETTESTWTVVASPDTENVFNEGNIDCYPTIEITATASLATGIELKNESDNDVLFSYTDSTFITGKKLTINCHNGTIDLDGTNTIRYFEGQFLRLLAGMNTLEYTGGNCTIVIKHRDRWL